MNTKQKADALIDYLANKELSFPVIYLQKNGEDSDTGRLWCEDKVNETDEKYIGSSVLIGDVLKGKHFSMVEQIRILQLWEKYGFTKSLNEIFDGEIESFCSICDKRNPDNNTECQAGASHFKKDVFTNKDTQSLLDFLWDLFGEEITKKND